MGLSNHQFFTQLLPHTKTHGFLLHTEAWAVNLQHANLCRYLDLLPESVRLFPLKEPLSNHWKNVSTALPTYHYQGSFILVLSSRYAAYVDNYQDSFVITLVIDYFTTGPGLGPARPGLRTSRECFRSVRVRAARRLRGGGTGGKTRRPATPAPVVLPPRSRAEKSGQPSFSRKIGFQGAAVSTRKSASRWYPARWGRPCRESWRRQQSLTKGLLGDSRGPGARSDGKFRIAWGGHRSSIGAESTGCTGCKNS